MSNDHEGLILDSEFFFGTEQEGPRKGQPTLFVAGDKATPDRVLDLVRVKDASQVYFGSGRLSGWNGDTILQTLTRGRNLNVALEIHGDGANCAPALSLLEALDNLGKEYLNRMLVVVTLLMIRKDGTVGEHVPGTSGHHVAMLLGRYPDNVLIKVDTGSRVHVLSKYSDTWTNDFTGYGKDEAVR